MKSVLIAIWLAVLLINGCAQTGPKVTENAVGETQAADAAAAEQTMLDQARAFRKARPELFGEAGGVLVTGLVPGGQGEKIGLMPDDMLLTYDGNPLQTKDHLIELVTKKDAQTSVTLTYLSGEEKHEVLLQGGKIGIQVASLMLSQSEEIDLMIERGNEAYYQSRFQEALQLYQQALKLSQENGYPKGEANSLNNLGLVYSSLGQYQKVIEYQEVSLKIRREIGDRNGEAQSLGNLGAVYHSLGQYQKAIEYQEVSLKIRREIGDRNGEAQSLGNLGNVYDPLGKYQKAIEHYETSMKIFHEIGDRNNEARSLGGLGNVYYSLGQYPKAFEHYEASLKIRREIGDRIGEAASLSGLGLVYHSLGQYPRAIEHHEASLKIKREIGDRNGEAQSLGNLGNVYDSLGQYPKAIEYQEASLKIMREIGDRNGEAHSLGNLGNVYDSLGQYSEALEYYEASLKIRREIGDRNGEAQSLNNLSNVYYSLDQYPEALEHYEASLKIKREIGDRNGEAHSLGNLGNVYRALSQYPQAIKNYQQAIAILMPINVPHGLWQSWSGLSKALQKLDRADAAILAGKRAVNVLQGMRSSNSALDQAQQKSFLENKRFAYQDLAELLIEQGRLIEAEEVMAMLKEEEYFNYIRRDSSEDNRTTRAEYTAAEKTIAAGLDRFGADLVTLGREYEDLGKLAQIDEQAKMRLEAVEKQLSKAQEAFNGVLSRLENYFIDRQGKDAVEFGERKLKDLEKQQAMLHKHQAVIITTVTAREKLYLLLTTPQVQLVRQSPIVAEEFNTLLGQLRNTLRHPRGDLAELKKLAQQLYAHLVKPLEDDLQQSGAKTLMWSLDGALRYIPMTVLHDGNRYLVEKYGMSLFTAASHSDWQEHAHESWRAAGLGVSHAIGEFSPLPSVPNELKSIIREGSGSGVLPGEIHLNEDFSLDAFKSVIRARYPVLHLASHFKLRSDNDASELLLGDGSLLKMSEFKQSPAFKMQRVDLLTLSACDTASGGEGSGGEIESFAVLAQLRGAGGVLASLWRVEDASTAQLMRRFYQLRNEDQKISKAEALRQAQIALLNGEIHSDEHDYSHPFFWSPFVMMGNWL